MDRAPPELPPLIASLRDPGRYPHPAAAVELLETHISWVLLAGDYAYKIKKPVDLGFLDFSTLEQRHHFCEEEVRLNRRLAPALYLDVMPVTGTPEQPVLGGRGEAIEFAVRMRRFPQAAQLDRMLRAGELHASHLDAFARMVADFHAAAAVATAAMPYGEPAAIYGPVEENFHALRDALGAAAVHRQLNALDAWSMTRFLANREVHAARKRDGFVRECHGDLHLRNLAWVDDQPLAFDCIEFAPALRWIDVISEVAFLVMDLRARAEPQLAARFLNRYLEYTGDYGAVAVLGFYLVYRALVRAKVDAIRLHQPDLEAAERAAVEAECARYLDLAREFCQPGRPRLIVTRGLSASGKTTLSEPLVEAMGAVRIRSDVERKRLFGLPATSRARAAPGTGIYTPEAGRRTYARLLELARDLLDAGYPVIVDAVFARAEQRAPFQALAEGRGVPYAILEFTASPQILRQRIAARRGGESDAGLAVLESQLQAWEALPAGDRSRAVTVDTESAVDVDALAARLLALSR
jgi:aminoglycoside phosphotransferase family enzyme